MVALLKNTVTSSETDKKMKLMQKIWHILNSFLKGKYINFSVFQLFGDSCFVDYLKINLEFKYYFFEYVFLYPKMLEMYVENLSIISESLTNIIFESMDIRNASYLLEISFRILKKFTNDEFNNSEYKSLNEDIILSKATSILYSLC